VWGAKTVPGGFDSHALPPLDINDFNMLSTSKYPMVNRMVNNCGNNHSVSVNLKFADSFQFIIGYDKMPILVDLCG
ncbi:MAG: hypothetical protein WCR46_00495, partial [Deltaproteobacteria bacterium]